MLFTKCSIFTLPKDCVNVVATYNTQQLGTQLTIATSNSSGMEELTFSHTPSFFNDSSSCAEAFGIEIEFIAPPGFNLDTLGHALYESKLTCSPMLMGYHAKNIHDINSHIGGWRFEEEHTILGGAEIISPRMLPNSETWENINLVTDLLELHELTAEDANTGFHVHVDIESLENNPSYWDTLFQVAYAYQDYLFVVGTNPERGIHRKHVSKNTYQEFLLPPPPADNTIMGIVHTFMRKPLVMNTYNVSPRRGGHIEFKFWDGTVNPAYMQLYVALSVGLVRLSKKYSIKEICSFVGVGALSEVRDAFHSRISDSYMLFERLMVLMFDSYPVKNDALTLFAQNWDA